MTDPPRQLREAIMAYPPEVRETMLRTLAADSEARAECFRHLYEDPRSREMAELLMDLEEDQRVKAEVMEALSDRSRDLPKAMLTFQWLKTLP